jgi:hypothetical protein
METLHSVKLYGNAATKDKYERILEVVMTYFKTLYSGTSIHVHFEISPTWYMSCLDAKNFAWYTTFVWNTTRVESK